MEIPLLKNVVIIIGLAVLVLLIFRKIRIPAILAFFVTGLLAGPHGLGLISSPDEVSLLADLGVIFLLFTIGIEFSLEKFSQIKRYVVIGGSLQLTLTLAAVYLICLSLGFNSSESIFIGFLVSFSSTAIVLRLLQEKDQMDSIHGQISLGILIFQDIAVVLVILFTPVLAGINNVTATNWPLLIAMGAGLILFTFISAKWIVPELLHYVARFKSRELFLLTIILICFGITWITSSIGLSTALGAFLAGLIISNTDYSHQALGNVLPFQDIFMSFFFVSIGMLLNPSFMAENLLLIIAITLAVLILKSLITGITAGLLGLSFRVMILVGLILSQIGEFSFILAATGLQLGIVNQNFFQIFLAVSLITMSVTPFIMAIAPLISNFSDKLPLPPRIKHGFYPFKTPPEEVLSDHLVIVGFGINGKNMAKAASKAQIPYVVVEINPEIVRNEKVHGESIYFGDAAHGTVLKNVNIREARIMVVAISDPIGTLKILDVAKKLNPNIYIIVRTRYIRDMENLYQMGADEIIPEEFETSIEIFSRVLDQYDLSKEQIDDFITEIRSDGYQMFRTLSQDESVTCTLNNGANTEVFSIPVGSDMDGEVLTKFMENYNGEVLAVVRNSKTFKDPDINFKILEDDMVIMAGEKRE
ncbi:cation:proton antiporter [Methanobacterium petrolearium]|uniref:cation:proton antiporter n=1 Tax=Methanobacterium petrolearium TaxID=710190 RepID=UPI001AE2F728|nr:cation:proton antiporter [Methanobacterium petrolearium]MBP1945849.1 CPA2 family monovalent cation:H+ antiporter-2 [Methanobacterium petrolearium]BDZ69601.1 potassium transporter KefB [Methanobacterium petrolearium]